MDRRACILIAAGFGAVADAQPIPIVRIADTSTFIPGTTAPFQVFNLPSAGAGVVGFNGFNGGLQGAYRGNGVSLVTIANQTTISPNGVHFIGFFQGWQLWPSFDGDEALFEAGDGIEGGIFLKESAGVITRVATTGTQVPNGAPGGFFGFGTPVLRAGGVAFVGAQANNVQIGVYRWQDGIITAVADKSTPIPGGSGLFTNFASSDMDRDGVLIFSAQGTGYRGIFRQAPGGPVTRLYDISTLVPGGGGGAFTFLTRASIDRGHVVFVGAGAGQDGLYTDLSGALASVVQIGTPVPGSATQHFTSFGFSDISGDIVVFTGSVTGSQGVYFYQGGTLHRVIAPGDVLDGRIVDNANCGPAALEGTTLALNIDFTNGSRGVYMATLPSSCYPDCNADTLLNLSDFGCFQTKFALAQPYADCNGDGVRNLSDFGCFITKFALGCP